MEGKISSTVCPCDVCMHRDENSLKMLGEACFILVPFGSQSKLVRDNEDNKCC